MRALVAIGLVGLVGLAGCNTASPISAPQPGADPGAPIEVSFASLAPAGQPLPASALTGLPIGVRPADVFIAPDGCYFFLQGGGLLLLTVPTSRGEEPYCP